jgi:hypothetical protein
MGSPRRTEVEAGAAQDAKEVAQAMWLSSHCIVKTLSAERIIGVVSSVAGVDPKDLVKRQSDCRWRAVTARMLCRYGGLTQRRAATILGVCNGIAVSCQLRKLADKVLTEAVQSIEKRLGKERGQ